MPNQLVFDRLKGIQQVLMGVHSHRSGQLDVVVEYPFSPSLPIGGHGKTRLYLAESVAAVVEVKSDVANQWDQAVATAQALAPLRRSFGGTVSFGDKPSGQIPLFVAGYTGWQAIETVKQHVDDSPEIAGVLVIKSGVFVSSAQYGVQASGPWSLWGLISCLHRITNGLMAAATNPIGYAL
jgi:Domain of unknown function (DUF6602)